MEREFAAYLRLQQRRVDLLRALCASLAESQRAIAGMNLDEICRATSSQEQICGNLRALDSELRKAQAAVEASLKLEQPAPQQAPKAVELATRLREMAAELQAAEAEVRRLNKLQAALLRRSQRSVRVLVNFLSSYSETYAPPTAPRLTAGMESGARVRVGA